MLLATHSIVTIIEEQNNHSNRKCEYFCNRLFRQHYLLICIVPYGKRYQFEKEVRLLTSRFVNRFIHFVNANGLNLLFWIFYCEFSGVGEKSSSSPDRSKLISEKSHKPRNSLIILNPTVQSDIRISTRWTRMTTDCGLTVI